MAGILDALYDQFNLKKQKEQFMNHGRDIDAMATKNLVDQVIGGAGTGYTSSAAETLGGYDYAFPPREVIHGDQGFNDNTGTPFTIWHDPGPVRRRMLGQPAAPDAQNPAGASPVKAGINGTPNPEMPSGIPSIYSTPGRMDELQKIQEQQAAAEAEQAAAAANDPSNDPYIQELIRMREALSGVMPQRSQVDPYSDYEQAAKDQLSKTNSLANVAIFSGIMKQAGYGDIADGFLGAAGMHDSGYKRYLDVMKEAAGRKMQRMDQEYNDQVALTNAASGLASDRIRGQIEARQKAMKERGDMLDYYFKKRIDAATSPATEFGDSPETMPPDELMRLWELSRQRGELVKSFNDVSGE